jgi:hypothetical protein
VRTLLYNFLGVQEKREPRRHADGHGRDRD